ncbi:MAG: hypothetical protein KKA79_02230 [Nanoarchaeota archaeon]|nr:hypothetical protein [Nanoarchaeota archaeon]
MKTVLGLFVGKEFAGRGFGRTQNAAKILLLFMILAFFWVTMMQTGFAADPGHTAKAISTGQFESGNYTFPDTLHIENYLNVTGLLWVDPLTNRVGIGTTAPGGYLPNGWSAGVQSRLVEIMGNDDSDSIGLLMRRKPSDSLGFDIWHSTGASYIDNRWDYDDSNLYIRTKTAGTAVNAVTIKGSGKVGIGTTSPSHTLHVAGDLNVTDTNLAMYFENDMLVVEG